MEVWAVMDDLSGSPILVHLFKDFDQTKKTLDLITYTAKGKLSVVSTPNNLNMKGLVGRHAYSLLNAIQHNGQYIYKIRNPWGRFEWSGSYAD